MTDAIATLKARYPGARTYVFGDNARLSAELLGLVRAGKKRATCSTWAEFADGDAIPLIGRCDIATTFDGRPALVNRTVGLKLVRFADMTEAMALAEGEDDSLDGWRAGHERYYRRLGVFDPQMELIWERFDVIEDLGAVDDIS